MSWFYPKKHLGIRNIELLKLLETVQKIRDIVKKRVITLNGENLNT